LEVSGAVTAWVLLPRLRHPGYPVSVRAVEVVHAVPARLRAWGSAPGRVSWRIPGRSRSRAGELFRFQPSSAVSYLAPTSMPGRCVSARESPANTWDLVAPPCGLGVDDFNSSNGYSVTRYP